MDENEKHALEKHIRWIKGNLNREEESRAAMYRKYGPCKKCKADWAYFGVCIKCLKTDLKLSLRKLNDGT